MLDDGVGVWYWDGGFGGNGKRSHGRRGDFLVRLWVGFWVLGMIPHQILGLGWRL